MRYSPIGKPTIFRISKKYQKNNFILGYPVENGPIFIEIIVEKIQRIVVNKPTVESFFRKALHRPPKRAG